MAHVRWSLVGSFECALPRSATQWLRWQHDEHEAGVVAVLRTSFIAVQLQQSSAVLLVQFDAKTAASALREALLRF